MGPAVEINFGHQFGRNPDRFSYAAFFCRYRFERSPVDRDRLELAIQCTCRFMCKTGAGAPGIVKLIALIETKHQGSD